MVQKERYEDPFAEIAPFYDHLMRRVPYLDWADYLEALFARHDLAPERLLDLACGTGTLALEMAKRDYRVVGVDASPAMIAKAKEKAAKLGLPVDFHVQLAQELALPGRFDVVFSVFDSLNYILEPEDLKRTFEKVAAHLEPGGAFIFDLNTEVAFERKLFNQDNHWDKEDFLHFKWRGKYDKRRRICTVQLQFTLEEEGRKRNLEITHRQRAYAVATVQRLLWEAGLELVEVYEAYTVRPLKPTSDRAYYFAQKRQSGRV